MRWPPRQKPVADALIAGFRPSGLAQGKPASLESAFGSVGHGGEFLVITGPGVPAEVRRRDLEFVTVMASRSIYQVALAQVGSCEGPVP